MRLVGAASQGSSANVFELHLNELRSVVVYYHLSILLPRPLQPKLSTVRFNKGSLRVKFML